MRDGPDEVPLHWREMVAAPDLFSVPRRFDLATVLVAMLGFAILFAVMRWLDMTPSAMALIGGLFTVVAFGQWIAASRGRPREASIVAAMVFVFAGYLLEFVINRGGLEFTLIPRMILFSLRAMLLGVPSGYLVGTLVGGVFLVSHHLREHGALRRRDASAVHPHGDSPWDEPKTDLSIETAESALPSTE